MQYKEANTRRYKKGQFVFVEGDDAFEAYIVLLGSVEISIGKGAGRKVLDVITENQMFGEMGVIADIPRTATGRCLEDTELVVVDRGLIETKVRDMDPYIRYLMESLISRLIRTSHGVRPDRAGVPSRLSEERPGEVVEISGTDSEGGKA
ncbi:cyclic nucleotide-binding domain-containing protein [Nisaea acidiphila]|uniref:Cyclic nucleotide-binding domain-containing protein n=1 Tax=Nisaea acidiphila TaxID=1862145 RepID=A0A9J7B1V1_9PROT|nr:cyclic nucleotide-binding domain-containing protein [Nisaea acidiphila]UUX51645.1 cyclic nucleotide-binding domain-containing protein [Nisaea acidiphila]